MEGKVELTIERYEDLRALERGEHKKIDELTAELEKAKDEKLVWYRSGTLSSSMYPTMFSEKWETRDSVVAEISKALESEKEKSEKYRTERNKAQNELADTFKKLDAYTTAPFLARLKYLFTKELLNVQ